MKQLLNRCLRRVYNKLPLRENDKLKLKRFFKRYLVFLTANISYQEWKNLKSNLDFRYDQNLYINDLFYRASEKSQEFIEKSDEDVKLIVGDIKLIAYYLPQFHPFAENDEWWGKGFTEWTNVTKAVPQFCGHYQPHLPSELGFYDLRLIEVQKQQIELAKKYGIYGFCYYYYWFSGKLLMEEPLHQVLSNSELDFPFCICWANENWSRRWDGMEEDILIKQNYTSYDNLEFIKSVEDILRDPRYIRINNKPVLAVYRVGLLPEPLATVKIWRDYCKLIGIGEIYLLSVQGPDFIEPTKCGFDAAVEFPPHTIPCPNITNKVQVSNPSFHGIMYDLEAFVKSKLYLKATGFKMFKAVMTSWDNTARRPNDSTIFLGASPAIYKQWLMENIVYTKKNNDINEQYVFINAWNEWAEGAHLEPDRKYGYAYLQATAEAIIESRNI